MDKFNVIGAAILLVSLVGTAIVSKKKTEHDLRYNLCSPALEMLHNDVAQYQKEHPEDTTPYNELFARFYKEYTEREIPKPSKKHKK